MYEEEAGWRWGQEGRSKVSETDPLLEKEHPAAVPPGLSILPASWVRVGSGLQGGKGADTKRSSKTCSAASP